MEIFSKKTNYDFMGKGKIAIVFSLLLIIGTIYVWFQQGETKYGTDYVGGFEFVLQLDESIDDNANVKIREAFQKNGFDKVVVQSYKAGSGQYAVRLPRDVAGEEFDTQNENKFTAAVTQKVQQLVKDTFAEKCEVASSSYIGPTIGSELQKKALIAFIFGLLGITAYISWRFEFAFALGAVVAVFHDAIVTLGIYLFTGYEITMTTLAAVLTIVGYSVNDTIVIFDRVREEIFKRNDYDLVPLMNECINATLSRTIITTLSTLFAAVSLLVIGGGAIEDLSFFLVVGLIVGTYSTIFIASPVVVAWEWFATRKTRKAAAA